MGRHWIYVAVMNLDTRWRTVWTQVEDSVDTRWRTVVNFTPQPLTPGGGELPAAIEQVTG